MSRSTSGVSTPQKAPKMLSSKLANMKFMQRGPDSTSSPLANDTDVPSAKRQKTAQTESPHLSSVQSTPQGEGARLFSGNSTETMWTLIVPQSEFPQEESDEESPPWEAGNWGPARMAFGKRKEISESNVGGGDSHHQSDARESHDENDESEETSSGADREESSAAQKFAQENMARVKAAIAERRRAGSSKAAHFAKDRKKKEVNLNKTGSGRVSKSGGRSGIGGTMLQ